MKVDIAAPPPPSVDRGVLAMHATILLRIVVYRLEI
jgi:hypothetical protein